MTRRRLTTPARLTPFALAALLTFAACGSDGDTAEDGVAAVSEDSTSGGVDLMSPRPIEVAGSGGSRMTAESAQVATDMDVATDMIAPFPYRITTFVAGEGLPALPANDVGYVFEAGQPATAEQVAALAVALGVEGEPVQIDDGVGVSWRVGPDDGSAPSLWVGGDAQLSWSYSAAWATQDVSVGGCAEPAAPDVGAGEIAVEPAVEPRTIDPATSDPATSDLVTIDIAPGDVVCATPEPPEGVPSADEAQARTRELMEAIGVDPAGYSFEPYADEWYASVNAVEQLDGAFPGRNISTGFGAGGAMQYAGGQLAEPVRVGPYPLIDLDTALARLNDPSGYYGGGGMVALDSSVARAAIDEPVAIDVAEAPVEAAVPETNAPPTDVPATDAPAASPAPDAPATDAPAPEVPATNMPEPDVPVSTPAPEEVTVTLVDVEPDVWWAWDVDGSAWILPAYRFIGDDGGWYTVPAVTDEFLVQVPVDTMPVEPAPEPAPEPLPVDTGGAASTVAPDGTPAELVGLVGLPLGEFTAAAEGLGYSVRVVYNDEAGSLPATDDFIESRINVHTRTQDGVEVVHLIANLG